MEYSFLFPLMQKLGKLITKCTTYSRKATGLFFTGHGVYFQSNLLFRLDVLYVIVCVCAFDTFSIKKLLLLLLLLLLLGPTNLATEYSPNEVVLSFGPL